MKKIGIAIGVILLLMVGLYTVDFTQRVISLAETTNYPALCSLVPKINWFNMAYINPELAHSAELTQSDCYIWVALAHKNLHACDMLTGGSPNHCYKAVAEKYSDVSVCQLIDSSSESKGACYGFFAYNQDDIAICERLTEVDTRSSCFHSYNVSLCERMSSPSERENCILSINAHRD